MVSLAIASMARALDSGLIVIEAVVGAGGIICAGRIKRMRLEWLEGAGGSLLIESNDVGNVVVVPHAHLLRESMS